MLGEAFGDHWAGYGVVTALRHAWIAPHFERHGGRIAIDGVIPDVPPAWLRHPRDFVTRYSLDTGYAFYRALRRHVFELDDEAYAAALGEATSLRAEILASDADDRMPALYGLAFVFSRDGSWAVEHAEEMIDTRAYRTMPGSNLVLASLSDAALASRLIRAHPRWLDPYGGTDPLLFDIVEASPIARGGGWGANDVGSFLVGLLSAGLLDRDVEAELVIHLGRRRVVRLRGNHRAVRHHSGGRTTTSARTCAART